MEVSLPVSLSGWELLEPQGFVYQNLQSPSVHQMAHGKHIYAMMHELEWMGVGAQWEGSAVVSSNQESVMMIFNVWNLTT